MYRLLRQTISAALFLFLVIIGQAYADGISGGGSGVHGLPSVLHGALDVTTGAGGYGLRIRQKAAGTAQLQFTNDPVSVQWALIQADGTSLYFQTAGSYVFDNTVTSTKACATNYTRIGPNYCLYSASPAWNAMTIGSVQTLAAPTGAVCWDLDLQGVVKSQSAVGLRGVIIAATTSGGSVYRELDIYGYEQAATAATTIEQKSAVLRFNVVSGNVYYNITRQGASSTAAYLPVGYCD